MTIIEKVTNLILLTKIVIFEISNLSI